MSEDDSSLRGITRRSFLTGTSVTVAAAGILKTSEALAADAAHGRVQGPGAVHVSLKINGAVHALEVEPSTTLADALRFGLGLTGTKVVCDRGSCSACTVHLDGVPVCVVPDARGRCRRARGHDRRGAGARRDAGARSRPSSSRTTPCSAASARRGC